METKLLFLSIFIVLGSVMSASVDFSTNSAEFSVDLYNKLSKSKPNENVIISPLSVETATGLAYMGAGGQTAEEIIKGLRLGTSEKSTVGTNFKELLDLYKDGKFLKIANKIYIGKDLEIKPEFNEIAKSQFHSAAESVDFAKAEATAETINKWVEDKTNNKIKDVVSAQSLSPDLRMIIVNAIHFKANWETQFYERSTAKHDFHVSQTDKTEVDMMTVSDDFKYGEFDDLKAKALEMKYKDSDFSMIFILPNEIDGLPEVEDKLLHKNLLDISKEMQVVEVNAKIPKFKIEFSVDLGDTLSSMGMTQMFSNKADFSNLSSESLKVSQVIHKAFIEVNEKGTEAAAATVYKMMPMSAPYPPIVPKIFTADHPFFFAIKSTSNIIFTGKYVKN